MLLPGNLEKDKQHTGYVMQCKQRGKEKRYSGKGEKGEREQESSPVRNNLLRVELQRNVCCIGSMAERAQHYCHQKTCYSWK